MNKGLITNLIAKVLISEAVLMLFPALVSVYYCEYNVAAVFFIVSLIALAVSIPISCIKQRNTEIFARDGFLIVALTWIVFSLVGALPFTLSGEVPNYVDAVFETVSGFTTTGSTILTNIEGLSKGLLMWRSFTHWVGGMGVLLFVMAIVPLTKRHSMHIMRAELTGATVGKLVPKSKATALWLYGIYFVLTVTQIVLLWAGGMPLFDSLATSFGTAGTGGFSVRNISVEAYNSPYAEYVIAIFMLIFSINFNIYYYLAIKRFNDLKVNEEWKVFLAIVGLSVLIIALNLLSSGKSIEWSFRAALFQVASI
ncbi:MAG: potassium transporter TrkG, partial [Eubacteriales bacterium]|nr:potassium transporter TrkG [Eubacteriales bacterium]